MSSTAVIRARQVFTQHGNSKNVNLTKELAIGTGLGIFAGLIWKVMFIPGLTFAL